MASLCSLVIGLPGCHSQVSDDGTAQGGTTLGIGGQTLAGGPASTGGTSSLATGTLVIAGGSSTTTGGNQSIGGQRNTGVTTTGGSFDNGIGGGSTGSTLTGGASTMSAFMGGASNTGGTSTASGTSAGGASSGGRSSGTGDCVNVCALYGPVCCVTDLGCVKPGSSCIVDVLEGNVNTTYTYTDLEQKIAALPQNVRFSFADTDIAWAGAHPDLGAHFEFHMTGQWSALHDTDITEHMDGIPFRLSCNGQQLFVGVFYILWGQAALDTPVLHPDRDTDNSVILRLGAWEGAWASYTAVGQPGDSERIDRPELRSVLCQRGALRVLDPAAVPPSS